MGLVDFNRPEDNLDKMKEYVRKLRTQKLLSSDICTQLVNYICYRFHRF